MNRRQLFQSLASVALAIVGVRVVPKAKPGVISAEMAARLYAYWEASWPAGRISVLGDGDGLTYVPAARQKLFARHVMHNIKDFFPSA